MIKCIAIDDEPLALRQLRTYIARVPFLELAGEYRNALEASRALEEQSVDLIFCDINMPDLSGIDFVRSLSAEQRPMIVFTTAYSEYAVEGFKLEAIDYLLKPFGFDEFNRAAQRAKSLSELIRSRREHPEETTESISLPQDSREFLSIKTDHMVSLVKFENIIYLESMGEYVRIHTTEGKTLTALYRLKNMEAALPADTSCAYTAPTSSTCAASPAMPRGASSSRPTKTTSFPSARITAKPSPPIPRRPTIRFERKKRPPLGHAPPLLKIRTRS